MGVGAPERCERFLLSNDLFFDDLYLQIVKFNMFNKLILSKTGLGVKLEIVDVGVQPDRFAQIKFIADVIKRLKHHLGPGKAVVADTDGGVLDQMVVFDDFSPHTEHK